MTALRTVYVYRRAPATHFEAGYLDLFIVGTQTMRGSARPWRADPRAVLLPPGHYRADPSRAAVGGQPTWQVTEPGSSSVPVWRDVDGDGVIDRDDMARSRLERSVRIAIHIGGVIPALGCLVVDPRYFPELVRAVGGAGASIHVQVVS